MPELQTRLEKLMLRLDLLGMRVEQAFSDALQALRNRDTDAARQVEKNDSQIDREEVEIEQECIRLLALYQPAAVDLRGICMIIKVNNDLERIADRASGIAARVRLVVSEGIDIEKYPALTDLAQDTLQILERTVRATHVNDASTARSIIDNDKNIDRQYAEFVKSALASEENKAGGVEKALTLIQLAKAMERIGDLCTNIAEDVIFLSTGDVVRHSKAFDPSQD